jgi:hypothetical protein
MSGDSHRVGEPGTTMKAQPNTPAQDIYFSPVQCLGEMYECEHLCTLLVLLCEKGLRWERGFINE